MPSKTRPVKRLVERYEPGEGKAQVVERPSQLTDILWRAARGAAGRRNVAIVWMLFGAGLRINEVAQLRVKDIYRPDGSLKTTFVIPGRYTKTGKSRIAYIVVRQQREALESWRGQRIEDGAMLSQDGSFGQLAGDSPLFLSLKGSWRTFAFNVKRYMATDGVRETLVCSSLGNLMREILKGSGIQGGSSHSGRRTLATWLDRQGCDLELIHYVLNHEDPEMTIRYIDASDDRLGKAADSHLLDLKMPQFQN